MSFTICYDVGEASHGLGEFFDGQIGISVLDAIPDTMLDMPLQNDLAHAMQGCSKFCYWYLSRQPAGFYSWVLCIVLVLTLHEGARKMTNALWIALAIVITGLGFYGNSQS